jgi:hypothetical protein
MENITTLPYEGPTTVTGAMVMNEIEHWMIQREIARKRLAEASDILKKLEIAKEVLKNLDRF